MPLLFLVGAVAACVVSSCLNEDANLFIRSIAEKLLSKVERLKALSLLRKLPVLLPELSPNVANSLFNQTVGCCLPASHSSLSKKCKNTNVNCIYIKFIVALFHCHVLQSFERNNQRWLSRL